MSDVARDVIDVIDVVNQSFVLVDGRDFDGYRALLSDEVEVDFGGVNEVGGEPGADTGVLTGDALAAAAHRLVGSVTLTQHMISTHVVTVSGDEATVRFYEQALHYHPALGEDTARNTWVIYGRGERRLRRTPDGWKIVAAKLRPVYDTGNVELLADVARSLR